VGWGEEGGVAMRGRGMGEEGAAALCCAPPRLQTPRCPHHPHLQREDTGRQLRHRVRVVRQRLDHALDVLGQLGAPPQLLRDGVRLRLGGQLPGEQQPQEALWEGLAAGLDCGELGLRVCFGGGVLYRVTQGEGVVRRGSCNWLAG